MSPCKCALLLLLAFVASKCPCTQATGVGRLLQAATNRAAAAAAAPAPAPQQTNKCTPPRTLTDTLKPYCFVPSYLSPGAKQFLAAAAAGYADWNLDFHNKTAVADLRRFFRDATDKGSDAAKAVFLQSVRNDTISGVPVLFGIPKGADIGSKPADTKLVLYFHGGGYAVGSCSHQWSTVAPTAAGAGLTAVCVEYRLAPEHPFPAGLNDALAVYKGLLEQGYQAKNIVLLGDSAGGGMVAAVAIQLQREEVPLPAALGMFSPFTDPDPDNIVDTQSTMIAVDPIIPPSIPGVPGLGLAYVGGDKAKFEDALVAPIRADWGKLFAGGKLPPSLIQVGLGETLLSQAVQLYHALKAASPAPGHVTISPYDGMWHVFQAAFTLPEAEAAHKEMADFFGMALSGAICSQQA